MADYVQLHEVLPNLAAAVSEGGGLQQSGPSSRELADVIETQQTYRGFVWSQWFRQNFTYIATFLAALLGCGSPFSRSGGGRLFSLALPVRRERWLAARAAIGLAELCVIALVGSLAIAALSPSIGEHYGVVDAVVHGACLFVASSIFFGISLLFTTAFNDTWRPLLLGCLVAVAIGVVEMLVPRGVGLFAVMNARSYFFASSVPWVGLIVCAALTAALIYAAAANIARRDY